MIQRLNLSAKILVTLAPVFVLGVLLSIFLDYNFQKQTLLKQTQESAQLQSNIIKASLVNMMVTNLRVNDAFLHAIENSAGVDELAVLFHADSLYLLSQYQDSARSLRLQKREQQFFAGKTISSTEIYSSQQPLLIVSCSEHKHSSYALDSPGQEPFWLPTCEYLTVVMPFKSEAICQQCHNVPENKVLGAAYMEIGLEKTASALRMNTIRSISIFLVFSVFAMLIGFFIYNKYIAKPVYQLVNATEVLGTGNFDTPISEGYDNDEFGKLANAFERMRQRLKEVQQTLIQKERLSTLGQMASSIIHDFRSPMTTISLSLDALKRNQNAPTAANQKLYENISTSIQRMNLMTQELLEYSRGEIKLDINEHNVKEFVKHLAASIEATLQQKNIQLVVQDRCDNCNALFDKERLSRALINIINNSEDAMPSGGTLRFETIRDNGTVTFSISDTGNGIPEDVRDKLFDPFVTSGKKHGTGLGLAITKKIIEEHKGNISFTSALEKGTTFTIKIPVRKQEVLS
ncbi:MAG: HAMP domain-containing histidine kinase [Bacteroidetes bacterium]|nr:MAG: HAMP domain-containing histidine kinase [Bacteroidota bacterium]